MTQHATTAAETEQTTTAQTTTEQTDAPESWLALRRRRDESLAAPHGILAQVGLHWIDPDAGTVRPDQVPGSWEIIDGTLVVTFAGAELTLLAGAPEIEVRRDGEVTIASVNGEGDVRLASFGEDVHIDAIRRGGRIGLRLLDPAAPRLTGFDGVPTFPYDPALVLTGRFRSAPSTVRVGSALPWLAQELPSPGVATLEIAGTEVDLVLTSESSLLFTDETSGTESAEWRQVSAQLDGDRVRVDLNDALNFPSAFSVWGTCPRPPQDNYLPFPVRAGEARVEPTER
ncbi:DUF1684 domain-containing protein [Brachybacterium sp. AOP43-C2-M15]|uniref:DUF1684 domain-containing protein n=1 Tax=Brachybacterium sp. AOP43-C2-M15 TaxID=3457661 RepID=UPI004033E466